MLTHMDISGFRSLRHVSLALEPLNVLIGPNGSGKSNFMDVFALMSEAAAGTFERGIARRGGLLAIMHRMTETAALEFEFVSSTDVSNEEAPTVYRIGFDKQPEFELQRENLTIKDLTSADDKPTLVRREIPYLAFFYPADAQKGPKHAKPLKSRTELAIIQIRDAENYPAADQALQQLEGWSIYNPVDTSPDAPIRGSQVLRSGYRLLPDASNLAPVLYSLQSQFPALWDDISEILKIAYPDFHHMSFPAEGGDGRILLRWWERPFERDYGFSANTLSDGTLRFLCLLAILKSPEPPPLICIEEPEIGLHPEWIKLVAELLESAATRTQLVVTTHSPQLVSGIKPEHVIVVEKEDGETALSRLRASELEGWLDRFRLGDLWLAGHIGGRP